MTKHQKCVNFAFFKCNRIRKSSLAWLSWQICFSVRTFRFIFFVFVGLLMPAAMAGEMPFIRCFQDIEICSQLIAIAFTQYKDFVSCLFVFYSLFSSLWCEYSICAFRWTEKKHTHTFRNAFVWLFAIRKVIARQILETCCLIITFRFTFRWRMRCRLGFHSVLVCSLAAKIESHFGIIIINISLETVYALCIVCDHIQVNIFQFSDTCLHKVIAKLNFLFFLSMGFLLHFTRCFFLFI